MKIITDFQGEGGENHVAYNYTQGTEPGFDCDINTRSAQDTGEPEC